ncbi:MAG: hotdog fold thioesterase [Bacteroidota bacterium]
MAALPNTTGGLAALLGIELLEAGPDRVVATMPVTPDHHQPMGYLHGGASVAFAETLVSYGAFLGAPEGHTAFGMEINANHLRSKQDGLLTGVATPLHQGRTSQVWQVEIRDEAEKLVCVSRCTVAITPLRKG